MCLVDWLTKSQPKTASAQLDKHSKWSAFWLIADQMTGHRFPQFGILGTVPESFTCHIYICERVKVNIPNTPNISYISKLYYVVQVGPA